MREPQAPRLRVGAYLPPGAEPADRVLEAFTSAGHQAQTFVEPARAGEFQAILIAADYSALTEAIRCLSPHVRRGQIVVHLGLAYDARVLENLEARGAVVGNLCEVRPFTWVADAIDAIGTAVVTKLAEELQGTVTWADARYRPALIAQRCRERALGELGFAASLTEIVLDPGLERELAGIESPGAYRLRPEELEVAVEYVESTEGGQAAADLRTLIELAGRARAQAQAAVPAAQPPEIGGGPDGL